MAPRRFGLAHVTLCCWEDIIGPRPWTEHSLCLVGPRCPPSGISGGSVRREGEWRSVFGVQKGVSGCKQSRFLRNLKKENTHCGWGARPKLRARNREETLPPGYMRNPGCILSLFNRAKGNRNINKNRKTNSQNFGNTSEAPGTAVNSVRPHLI